MQIKHTSYEDAKSYQEYSSTNAWNFRFYDGYLNNSNNNNNKNNSYYVRPCSAFGDNLSQSVVLAFEDCLQGKRNSQEAIEYMPEAGEDLARLAHELETMTWVPSTSTCFMVTFPKLREVFAAAFRDRIVHHWICMLLGPLFEKRCKDLGNVSHACRKGYGTRSAIEQVERGICEVSCNMQKKAWIYKGDIVGFFMHLRKDLLWQRLERLIVEQYQGPFKDILLYAVKTVVMHHPEKDCVIRSDISLWEKIDKSKSLFYNDPDCGEPIGNLTTQHFAGFYLSFLDEYVIGIFVFVNYSNTRSMDDFVIVCDDLVFLKSAIRKIETFTHDVLGLECHADKTYLQPASHGVKFLGAWIKYQRKHTIQRTVGRMAVRIEECVKECQSERGLTTMDVARWASVLNSYFGFLVQTNSRKTRERMVAMFPHEFYKYFYVENCRTVKVRREYKMCG